MNDWQIALKVVLDKLDKKDELKLRRIPNKSTLPENLNCSKNRGRGSLPLLRSIPRTHHRIVIEDDEPPVRNWRRSPMEK